MSNRSDRFEVECATFPYRAAISIGISWRLWDQEFCALVVWLLESALVTFYTCASLFCIIIWFLGIVHLHQTPCRCNRMRTPSFGCMKRLLPASLVFVDCVGSRVFSFLCIWFRVSIVAIASTCHTCLMSRAIHSFVTFPSPSTFFRGVANRC